LIAGDDNKDASDSKETDSDDTSDSDYSESSSEEDDSDSDSSLFGDEEVEAATAERKSDEAKASSQASN
jgi:hypothetical protein